MDRLPEFISNHWMLSAGFVVLLSMLFLTSARSGGKTLSPALLGRVVNHDNGVLLDIRVDSEFRAGHIAGSLNIPQPQLATRLVELDKHKGRPVIVVCSLGQSAADAAKQLLKAGHPLVYRLDGGISAWRSDNLPVVKG